MRHVGRNQDEVRRLILPDVIADEPPTAAVPRQLDDFSLRLLVALTGACNSSDFLSSYDVALLIGLRCVTYSERLNSLDQ